MKIRACAGYVPTDAYKQLFPGPPYDVIDTAEARAIVAKNPFSVVRINRAETSLPEGTDTYSEEVYAAARRNLDEAVEKGIIKKDDRPHIYAYRQAKAGHSQMGFMALTAVEDYAEGRILKHEFTVAKKEADRIRTVDAQNANVGPVFLSYRSLPALNAILKRTEATEPAVDVPCAEFDKTRHTLWRLSEEDAAEAMALFDAHVERLYILDGHHRAKSAYEVGRKRIEAAKARGETVTGDEPMCWFLSVIYPHDSMAIFDYNRVIKSCPLSTPELIAKLEPNFTVTPVARPAQPEPTSPEADITPKHYAKPSHKRQFAMYRDGQWYHLELTAPVDESDPVKNIDSQILTDLVLEPVLGIHDLRTHPNVAFVGGDRGLQEMEAKTDAMREQGAIAFAVFPVTMEDLFSVAEAGVTMPCKSTFLLPKAFAGMMIRRIE
eukprot:gnl/Ergobibamus_cyprinoides/539.p2 GENE.gnl/Ergobibamus_cyprinoides/539~~gnl/Ergobibamus_cyprinoides/539.p2  ORF type:complete len:436 (+),score=202.03 gnl/Ergobibamus_cyprinoides/539:191-1498(+)